MSTRQTPCQTLFLLLLIDEWFFACDIGVKASTMQHAFYSCSSNQKMLNFINLRNDFLNGGEGMFIDKVKDCSIDV
ncbi:hypothetical protein DFH27DRAFT_580709, partial [Peziza echinospora]